VGQLGWVGGVGQHGGEGRIMVGWGRMRGAGNVQCNPKCNPNPNFIITLTLTLTIS